MFTPPLSCLGSGTSAARVRRPRRRQASRPVAHPGLVVYALFAGVADDALPPLRRTRKRGRESLQFVSRQAHSTNISNSINLLKFSPGACRQNRNIGRVSSTGLKAVAAQ